MTRERSTHSTRRKNQAAAVNRGTRNANSGTGTRNPEPTRIWVRAVVIVLAAALVYANSLSAPFIFDDQYSIVENPQIRSLSTAHSQPTNTPLTGRPVAGLSFALNFAVSELDPSAYRATNVVIHLICALLLFGIVRRTLELPSLSPAYGPAAPNLATAAALLWAVHPLTTDAVTYITQRTESLMALFYLLTLYASIRAHTSRRPSAWHGVAIGACVLGMGSKESMVTAPLAVILYDRIFLFNSNLDTFRHRWHFYLGLALTWIFLGAEVAATPRANSAGFASGVSVWTYLLNQAVIIVRYLRLVFWPADLVINYGQPVAYTLRNVLPQAAVVITLLWVTVAAFRWNAPLAFLGAWFFITLAPTSSFVPIATEVAAERRMYLPLMAVVSAVVMGSYGWTRLRRHVPRAAAAIAVAVVAVALGAGTIRRNAEHQSWLTLAETTLDRWPSDAAYAGVGGELARLHRDQEALPLLRLAARSEPRARYNLGVTLFNLKRDEEAIRELDVLVKEHPMGEEAPWARKVIGHAYLRLSRWADGIAQLRMVLTMAPNDAEARRLLVDGYNTYGVTLAQAGDFGLAISQFKNALALDDRNESARYNLATALFDAGRMHESFIEIERALALGPANADAHHLKGKLLALQGRMPESLASLETAARLSPNDPLIREDLARVQRAAR